MQKTVSHSLFKTGLATILCIHFILLSFLAFGQTIHQITGKVADTAIHANLVNANVTILSAKDSTLVAFTWVEDNGNFSFDKLKDGRFILLITYPEYADYVRPFLVDSSKRVFHFGAINLSSKINVIKEVMIMGKVAAIRMKGDTTEYNAGSFVIQPNAKVEDLLRQLPGIQVDFNGKITAQGQEVKKVLVDGEEFFGDDPTLVTRNLRGDMIDKVQLYDKKSDQAAFTGVDDGIKEKTINLKLKEDKKKGYFGKAEASGGTADFYQLQAMANVFREKQKMAIYGNIGNTGRTGLSSSDVRKYGTDGGTIEFITGGIMLTGTNADEIESSSGNYSGQGIPTANTSGAHYDGKWNNGRAGINANVKIGSLGVDGERNTITQNDLPSGLILNNSQQVFSNYNSRKRVDAAYQVEIDNTSSLKIKIDGITKVGTSETNYLGTSVGNNFKLLNRSNRKLTDNGNQNVLNMNAFYSKKFKKPGRTISLNLTEAMSRDNSTGYLNAINEFYDANGDLNSTATVDQYKVNEKSLNAFNSNLAFTESFSKTFSMVLNYRLGLINSEAERKAFNPSVTGAYTLLDSEFSNDFLLDQFSNQGGAVFTYQKGTQRIAIGSKITAVNFKQLDRLSNVSYNRNFFTVNPKIDYRYQPSTQQLFSFNYTGSTIQPSIDQLQPVKINTDPLNLVIGNPDLTPSFMHSFSGGYNSNQTVSGFSMTLIASYGLTNNPIVNSVQTDAFGASTYQFFNLKDKSPTDIVFRGSIGKKIKAIDSYLGIDFFFNHNTNYGISNSAVNERKDNSLTSSLSFSKFKSKKYSIMAGFGPRIFRGTSSLQNQLTNNGYGYDGYFNINLYLPLGFELNTNTTVKYQSKTEAFNTDYRATIINAAFAKKFLKGENLKFSVSGNDILNQNIGFRRSSFGTMVTQSSYTNIGRYFMFSLIWDFSKFGKSATNKN